MRMPSRDERMVPRRSQAVSIKVHCLVHVQETSLGMPRLSCQAPCPPVSKGGIGGRPWPTRPLVAALDQRPHSSSERLSLNT